jgi:polyisoprenyl-teichoic acid--peptidoglycan teichoic acid transferase
MSHDDERDERDDVTPPGEGDAGEHEPPPPATWAGRQRSPEPPADSPDDEAASDAPPTGDETQEYDAIKADLDRELAGVDDEDPPSEELEAEADEPAAEDEQAEESEAVGQPSGETVEAETVSLADREQAEEEALAGLRARVAKDKPDGEPVAAGVAAATADAEEDAGKGAKPPRARPLWARFVAATLVIVISMAAATSISLLLYLTDIAKGLSDNERLASLRDQLTEVDGGEPQTILIIGSDKRLGMKGDPGRSDTTILLRVDPDKDAIALLSIPRDLKVNIPGVGVAKFNEAYSAGQADKTLKVVQQLTGLEINHVVNINFTGFADAVDAIGCVYIDVDRRYYIPPDSGTAEINIEAGYQRMCGYNALQYVRFRHFDNDLVRSARQQDFLREARQKLPPQKLIDDRNELLDIFTDYTTSDIGDAVQLLELLKTFLAVQSAPVREVHFPAQLGTTYVTANDDAIKKAVAQFLDTEGTPGDLPSGDSPPNDNQDQGGGNGGPKENKPKPDSGGDHFEGPVMDDSSDQGQQFAHQISIHKKKNGEQMIDFPIYYPSRLAPGSIISADTRAFPIDGPEKDVFYGYKMVVDVPGDTFGHGLTDEFYGVSGTDWIDAPILQNPSETRTIDGKNYLLFYDGDRLRLVGWKTPKGAYWVNNTLLQSLDEGQMLSIATSMREYQSK